MQEVIIKSRVAASFKKHRKFKTITLLIGGNSLIGDFALIKDMNPKMQVRSKNAGANHQIQGGGLIQDKLLS